MNRLAVRSARNGSAGIGAKRLLSRPGIETEMFGYQGQLLEFSASAARPLARLRSVVRRGGQARGVGAPRGAPWGHAVRPRERRDRNV